MPLALAWIEEDLERAQSRLRKLSFFVYGLAKSPLAFFVRKRLMAISNDINAITVTVTNLAEQAPPAITAALAAATAAGGDTNAPAAVANLQAAVGNLTTGLQAALGGNVTV